MLEIGNRFVYRNQYTNWYIKHIYPQLVEMEHYTKNPSLTLMISKERIRNEFSNIDFVKVEIVKQDRFSLIES